MNYARIGEVAAWLAAGVMGYLGGVEWWSDNPDVVTGVGGVVSSLVMTLGIISVRGAQAWMVRTGYTWLGSVVAEAVSFVESIRGPGNGPAKKREAIERILSWFDNADLPLPWWVPESVIRRVIEAAAEKLIDGIVKFFNDNNWVQPAEA